jgi:hypothetical protein
MAFTALGIFLLGLLGEDEAIGIGLLVLEKLLVRFGSVELVKLEFLLRSDSPSIEKELSVLSITGILYRIEEKLGT